MEVRNDNILEPRPASIWKALPEGIYKLNVDVVFFFQLREANLEMVVRDHAGTITYFAVTRVDVDEGIIYSRS